MERCITFGCSEDMLVGILHDPQRGARDLGILIIVGGPQYRVGSHRQFVLMARRFAAAGYPVLRFDYRGMGDSSGRARTFEEVDEDISAAMAKLHDELPHLRRVILFGLCDAASAALMHVAHNPGTYGLILANPWVRTSAGQASAYVRHYYGYRILQRAFWSKLFTGRYNLVDSLRSFAGALQGVLRTAKGGAGDAGGWPPFLRLMERGIEIYRGPTLLLLSDGDLTAREFDGLCRSSATWSEYVAAPHVSRVEVVDSDHTFSSANALDAACETVLAWLRRLTAEPPGAE